jgi:hypothetical protein
MEMMLVMVGMLTMLVMKAMMMTTTTTITTTTLTMGRHDKAVSYLGKIPTCLCRNPVDCWVRDVGNCLWVCRTPIGADSHVDEAANTGK